MRIQAYTAYVGTLTVAIATPRPEEVASTHFVAAKIHEDYCAQVRALLREHKHCDVSSLAYPAASRLQTYFPVFPLVTGKPLYALRSLQPAGSPRDIDREFMLEIMRVRYDFMLAILPPYFEADETTAEGIERALEYAVKSLFIAQSIPDVVIPGDNDTINGVDSLISITCELGAASARMGVDIPQPAA